MQRKLATQLDTVKKNKPNYNYKINDLEKKKNHIQKDISRKITGNLVSTKIANTRMNLLYITTVQWIFFFGEQTSSKSEFYFFENLKCYTNIELLL